MPKNTYVLDQGWGTCGPQVQMFTCDPNHNFRYPI